jgi:hypothetical protein
VRQKTSSKCLAGMQELLCDNAKREVRHSCRTLTDSPIQVSSGNGGGRLLPVGDKFSQKADGALRDFQEGFALETVFAD